MDEIEKDKERKLNARAFRREDHTLPGGGPFSSEVHSMIERMKGFARLEDGWNGTSAAAPNGEAIGAAIEALVQLEGLKLLPHAIAPSAESGIGFTFENGAKFGHIDFFNDGTICILVDTDGRNPNVWEASSKDHRTVSALLSKVRDFMLA